MVQLIKTEVLSKQLEKKSFGERHVIMQNRALDRQKMRMEMAKRLKK